MHTNVSLRSAIMVSALLMLSLSCGATSSSSSEDGRDRAVDRATPSTPADGVDAQSSAADDGESSGEGEAGSDPPAIKEGGTYSIHEDPNASSKAQAKAEARMVSARRVTAKALGLKADVGRGAALFKRNCAACHGEHGQGLIGPNHRDDCWIHGGSLEAITKTISEGIAEKGMPGWAAILEVQNIADLATYVEQLDGPHPKAKECQGTSVKTSAP